MKLYFKLKGNEKYYLGSEGEGLHIGRNWVYILTDDEQESREIVLFGNMTNSITNLISEGYLPYKVEL